MISTLCIKNVGIIDEITLNLNEGLNILTGETGARENTYNWCTWNNFAVEDFLKKWLEKVKIFHMLRLQYI